MSLVNLAHVCSHLQNASRARLATTAIPLSNMHLRLAQQMHRAGFISSVTVAGQNQPPAPSPLGTHPDPIATYSTTVPAHWAVNPRYSAAAATHPSDSTPPETPDNEPYIFVPESTQTITQNESLITKDTVASRRIWLGLKYFDNRPVIEHMQLVSKPTRRVWATAKALTDLARGQKWGYVNGVRQVGECLFVSTNRGILEIRECVERGLGGMILCRVW